MPLSVHHRRPSFWRHYQELAKNKELIEIYISMVIRTLSFAMIGIFVPLYLIANVGLTVNQTFIYYIIWAIGMVALYPLGGWVTTKIGFKHTMLLSAPIYVVYLILLMLMESYTIPYWIVTLVSALGGAFFWMAYHCHFALITHRKTRGEETSITFAIILAAGILGPILGGLIITYFGFITQFVTSIVLLIGSTIPLLFTKDNKGYMDLKIRYIFRKDHMKDFTRSILMGVRFMTEGIIWPIFLFQALQAFLGIGAISSVAALMGAVSAIIVGKLADKHSKRTLMKIGSIFDSAVWVAKAMITSLAGFFMVTSLGSIAFKLTEVPFDARIYNKASRENVMGFIFMREIGIGVGRVFILSLALAISLKGSMYATAVLNLVHVLL